MSEDRIRKHYESLLGDDVPGHRAADWADEFGQQTRFAVLGDNVELEGKRLLDVGCGTGDLWTFLSSRDIHTDYLGVDLVEAVVAEARKRSPDAQFQALDVFQPDSLPAESFDVVFCSGTLNLDLGNNRKFVPRAIARLVELSRETTVFNLLHVRAKTPYSHCFYWQPDNIREMLADFPGQIDILDSYLHNDFTVICRK